METNIADPLGVEKGFPLWALEQVQCLTVLRRSHKEDYTGEHLVLMYLLLLISLSDKKILHWQLKKTYKIEAYMLEINFRCYKRLWCLEITHDGN